MSKQQFCWVLASIFLTGTCLSIEPVWSGVWLGVLTMIAAAGAIYHAFTEP